MLKLLNTVAVVLTLTGCATADVAQYKRDPFWAAAADTATTALALEHFSGRELNPLGFAGATVGKGIYLWGIRPGLDGDQRLAYDRTAAAVWYGAAVSNALQMLFPGLGIGSFILGGIVGWELYQN